jgi:hypothetical protein
MVGLGSHFEELLSPRSATIVMGMVAVVRKALVLVIALGWVGLATGDGFALGGIVAPQLGVCGEMQAATPQATAPEVPVASPAEGTKLEDRPLPDIPTLMREVETNQRAAEKIEKDYLFRSAVTEQETDGHGGVKKTEAREYEVFWQNGVPVSRLLKKNGRELSAEEQKKENERIDKDAEKAKERRSKADEEGKESDPRGHELMTASRVLELGSFTNPKRVQLGGRDTIVADYAGDPKAKTRTRFEDVVKDMMGTVWVDERDRVLVKAEGHFVNNFKIGVGLVANIQKGTSFSAEWRKINDEVWLPARMEGQGSARALLFFGFNGRAEVVDSDYRKFKATSTILPGMSTVDPGTDPQ